MRPEFQPVGHSGGSIIIRVGNDEQRRRGYQITWQHCRPVPAAMFGVYALPQGIVFSQAELGGIGSKMVQPPVPGGCYLIFIGSDSEGLFGGSAPDATGIGARKFTEAYVRTADSSTTRALRPEIP